RVPGLRVDHRLEAIALRLMAKEPDDRFQHATDLLAHIDQVFGRTVRDTEPAPLPGDNIVEEVPDIELPIAADTPAPSPKLSVPVPAGTTTDELLAEASAKPSRGRSRAVPIALGVTVLLGAGGALWASLRTSEKERAPEAAPIAAADPAEEPDAVPAAAVVDAAATPVVAAPDAAPAAPLNTPPKEKDRHGKSRKDRKGKTKTPAVAEVKPTGETPAATGATAADFDKLYRKVGGLLDQLSSARGDSAAGVLRDRYFKIPYADALRSESVRRDAHRTLGELRGKIQALLAKKP
ncbi:MAG TPA: hypothetical protein VMZ28_16790, partial [Kofleriaceae bacterium]|nr:hypothetical protein [Kofleriaceae bacterium]